METERMDIEEGLTSVWEEGIEGFPKAGKMEEGIAFSSRARRACSIVSGR